MVEFADAGDWWITSGHHGKVPKSLTEVRPCVGLLCRFGSYIAKKKVVCRKVRVKGIVILMLISLVSCGSFTGITSEMLEKC